ncbi:hypothetical protein SAMN03159423_5383 [Bradyrhizobium sp. NFR13]|uniref:hypothetical protein n=1 Tax=Bradyrhizobium sp. NFR13 TaxID=1566285 RepID=UPI0008ECDB3F|nr:hypothetical protein [Bradyrhizobium sp. NFR13]SFM10366.1 hypothetical protein SAMN03159423_5383 [Bradyrhizobium sp. NFR13]
MKNIGLILLAAVVTMSGTYSSAQNNDPSANAREQPAATPHSSGSGTAPDGKGSTGWTGGARDQNSQTTGQATGPQDAEAAKDQPAMATGKDLQGPPKQFSPRQTPE